MKKKTKKGESQKKKRETIFQDTKKRQNTDKQNVKKVPNKKRKETKLFLRWSKKKTEKESFAEVYKDTKQKNCEKRFLIEKTKRQQKTKKKHLKGRQGESNEKTPRDKKREQVDLGRTRG